MSGPVLDEADVSALLTGVLDRPVMVTGKIGTYVNHTYFAQDNGQEYLVKLMTRQPGSASEKNRYLKTEVILSLLREQGIFVPKVYHADNTSRTVSEKVIDGLLIMERLDGEPLDRQWEHMTMDEKMRFARTFAALLRAVHRIEFPSCGEIDPLESLPQQLDWQQFIISRSEKSCEKLIDMEVMDPILLQDAVRFITENREKWTYTGTPRLIHGDIWRGNFLWQPPQLWLLDWEWSISGDPFYDLLWIETDIFFGEPEELSSLFYQTYGIDHKNELFGLKRRVLNTYASLVTAAFGFLYHNPSPEGYARKEEFLRHYIYGEDIST